MGWKKDFYQLKHPEKYLGDPSRVIFRSSWEEEAFKICDNNPYVLEWAAEFITIPYLVPNFKNPTAAPRRKRYIPDLYVVVQNKDKKVVKKLIEIKPLKQTRPSKSKNPRTKLYEDYTFTINQLKWQAAQEYCSRRGIEFIITTERELFGNANKRR